MARQIEPMNEGTLRPCLVPELAVTDIGASGVLWCCLFGFVAEFDRSQVGFAYNTLGTAHLMLDQAKLGRTCSTGALEV